MIVAGGNMRFRLLLLGCLGVLAGVVAANVLQAKTATSEIPVSSPQKIAETDLQIDSGGRHAYWLDDETLVFVGADSKDDRDRFGEPPVAFPHFKARIYIWKMGSTPQLYRPDVWPAPRSLAYKNYLCASEGKIAYSTSLPETGPKVGMSAKVLMGPVGEETPQEVRRLGAVDPRWSYTAPFLVTGKRCDEYFAPWMQDRYWSVSYDRKTILDQGPRVIHGPWEPKPVGKSGKKVRLFRVADRSVIDVPDVDAHWTDIDCVEAPSWEPVFVTWRCIEGRELDETTIRPVWKIFPDGRSERTDIQLGRLSTQAIIPVRGGCALISWGMRGVDHREDAGIYAVQGGKPVLGLKGLFRALAVSPDGCRVAYAMSTRHAFGDSRDRMIVLSYCDRKEGR